MKVLSLEEIEILQASRVLDSAFASRFFSDYERSLVSCLLHTAREYHRLRKSLRACALELDACYDELRVDEDEREVLHVAREALKEIEGEEK